MTTCYKEGQEKVIDTEIKKRKRRTQSKIKGRVKVPTTQTNEGANRRQTGRPAAGRAVLDMPYLGQ